MSNKLNKIIMDGNLKHLKGLVKKVNDKSLNGLNDDDEVKAMFDYQKKFSNLFIVVGWDSYGAIGLTQLKETLEKNGYTSNGAGMIKIRYSDSVIVGDVWITEKYFKTLE